MNPAIIKPYTARPQKKSWLLGEKCSPHQILNVSLRDITNFRQHSDAMSPNGSGEILLKYLLIIKFIISVFWIPFFQNAVCYILVSSLGHYHRTLKAHRWTDCLGVVLFTFICKQVRVILCIVRFGRTFVQPAVALWNSLYLLVVKVALLQFELIAFPLLDSLLNYLSLLLCSATFLPAG